AVAAPAARGAVPRRRRPLRPLVHLALRGLLPWPRHGRLAARRHRVALGRRLVGAAAPAHRARRAAAPARNAPRRCRRRSHRRVPLAVWPVTLPATMAMLPVTPLTPKRVHDVDERDGEPRDDRDRDAAAAGC